MGDEPRLRSKPCVRTNGWPTWRRRSWRARPGIAPNGPGPFEGAFEAVLKTEAGRQLEELRDGPHGDERAQEWQEDMCRERAEERGAELGEAR